MDAGNNAESPTLPPAAMEAINAPRAPDAPRRCFICLTDEDPSDPPNSWVDPCPCTLEAHQDCMLSWVTDCERSSRPLKCPVCKSTIEMEGVWDPVVMLSDLVSKRFTKTSPLMLFTAASMGVQFSLQMYGAMALWTFSGKDAMMRFVMGPEMMIDGRQTAPLAFARERITNALVLMNVAPALLVGHFFPGWSNKIFLPTASFYGIYHVMHDEQFFTWPPSPQLAMAVFPYIRSVYYNLYKELVLPYETKLNRQLLGLPPVEPQPEPNQNQNQNQGRRNGRDAAAARAQGGILGILQTLIDALEQDDEGDGQQVDQFQIDLRADQQEGEGEGEDGVMLEVIVEEVEADADAQGDEDGQDGHDADAQDAQAEGPEAAPAPAEADIADAPADAAPAPNFPLAVPEAPAAAPEPDAPGNHEAPQAPPRRMGLGAVLSSVSNAIVSALILPGVSFAAGEALRLVLPRDWTSSPPRNPWMRSSVVGGRPGLFQQQWGRSLVGGCIFIVLRDIMRVYTKTRKVAALSNRRVKNVDRPRRVKKHTPSTWTLHRGAEKPTFSLADLLPHRQPHSRHGLWLFGPPFRSLSIPLFKMATPTSKQKLALAICEFLSTSTTDGTLTADDKDSIDVAINCIAESFKVDPTDKAAVAGAIGAQNLLQIYSVYEVAKSRNNPAAAAAATTAAAAATTAAAADEADAAPISDDKKREADGLKSQGNAAMAQKDYATAIDLYTQALAIHPRNAVFLSNRAAAHSANKDHASARTDAEAAVAIDPAYTKAWSRLGLARFALGDAKGAMEAYGKGIEYEGNGGSDAMKKGYETAKRRVEESGDAGDDDVAARAAPGAGAGGMPDFASLANMFGGGGAGGAGGAGGGGGMPDLSSIMSNPMFASMAQNIMSNPDMMNNLMSNPRIRDMANQFGGGGGGGMPDLNSLMNDPNIAEMARNMMGGGAPPGGPGGPGGPGAGQ